LLHIAKGGQGRALSHAGAGAGKLRFHWGHHAPDQKSFKSEISNLKLFSADGTLI
jgi:hypothetical protein